MIHFNKQGAALRRAPWLPLLLGLVPLIAGCPDGGTESPTEAISTPTPTDVLNGYPSAVVQPSAVDFGEVTLGQSGTAALVVSNSGSSELTVSPSWADDGAGQFTAPAGLVSFTVAGGASVTLSFSFTPSGLGAQAGLLNLATNDESHLSIDVALGGVGAPPDEDGDGYTSDVDCDDGDPGRNPGAQETCDGVDQDCDGAVDEDLGELLYADADGDGYGDPATSQTACPAEGYVDVGGDCDDGDAQINPGAAEVCDGVDSNCDGIVDDDLVLTSYPDQDGDGFGDSSQGVIRCELGDGVAQGGDCDDADPGSYPGGDERCDGADNNCDGSIDEGLTGTYYPDLDGDGYGDATGATEGCGGEDLVQVAGDCDDSQASINPGAAEVCNVVDDNCDGSVDEGLTGTYYLDADADGYGDSAASIEGCSAQGYVEAAGDCDDSDAGVNPAAAELCNERDDNCDGQADEGLTGTYYADADGDGYGDPAAAVDGCPGDGYVANANDCDDEDNAVSPDASEICDGDDNNCNGEIDEGVTTAYYLDADVDGFGDINDVVLSCEPVDERVLNSEDCDDTDPGVNPGADELCDSGGSPQDDDCDGVVDESGAVDALTWYLDNDADNYGLEGRDVVACNRPNGYAAWSGDCDDSAPSVNPGADERCDEVDNNCDGQVDEAEAIDALTVYPDGDQDGYGVTDGALTTCDPPEGYVQLGDDCDDEDAAYNPGAIEADCTDPNDYNCDGSTAYGDADGDGYPACRDCDDLSAAVFPGGVEVCDGADNNCNGSVDEGVKTTYYIDNDSDGFGALYNTRDACEVPQGYTSTGGDCNDYNGQISPGSPELCDEIDNNCNGLVDEGLQEVATYPDLDGDSHGSIGSRPNYTCLTDEDGDGSAESPPYGFALVADDCDDSDVLIYTGAPERCDGEDNNCNGLNDETCFNSCGAGWPFKLDYSLGTPDAHLIDMNGDNRFETVVQDNFGFAILDSNGAPYYNYSAPVHNYSRRPFVAADIDTYASFTADTQNIELLTGNGSRPRFYRLNGDRTVTVIERTDVTVYDASEFLASDLDHDGSPELLTTSWCNGNQGVMGFRYNRSTGLIDQLADIPDPDGTCIYTDGRTLTDLDGDGDSEIVFGNGYAHPQAPGSWMGNIYALEFTDPTNLGWDYYCDPEGCFDTDVADLFGGGVSSNLFRQGDRIWAQATYFMEDVNGANNPSTTRFWAYDLEGQTLDGYPSTSEPMAWPTDINDDGVLESRSEVANLGLFDVNGDGYPDRIYQSGDQLRLALWSVDTGSFVELVDSRKSISGGAVVVRSIWDMDDDNRLNVIATDDAGNVHCYELGDDTWNPRTSLPPHRPSFLRTNQWDNYEPNEGADTTGDGIPDELIRVPSALTRYGHFYSYLSADTDVDTYLIDTGWGPNICLTAPQGRRYKMKIYSYLDRWNNQTHAPSADGTVDGLIYEVTTGAGGTSCFTGGSVAPSRNGEYRFVMSVESVEGSSAYWPYWIEARK